MKTIFIITGFKQKKDDDEFRWMTPYFRQHGFQVHLFAPDWNRNVMSDYVQEFVAFYNTYRSDVNYVLGFSFGAMIAFISLHKLKPDQLLLCSLSPYFREDLVALKPSMKRMVGEKRIKDFYNHSAHRLAKEVRIPVTIVYGEAEGTRYPQLKRRCEETHALLPHSTLVVIKNAPHHIDHPQYVQAVKDVCKAAW